MIEEDANFDAYVNETVVLSQILNSADNPVYFSNSGGDNELAEGPRDEQHYYSNVEGGGGGGGEDGEDGGRGYEGGRPNRRDRMRRLRPPPPVMFLCNVVVVN